MTEKIEIKKVGNGYVIKSFFWHDTSERGDMIIREEVEVIEEEAGEEAENESLKRLLERIAELTGYQYDKFGKENLNITFDKKGHKVE